ncbi:MAG: hypothetical protein GQ558_01395 [Thermoplasmata archaeon]|nr:hypothetical protein [Thermoplasmata archaeon]
MGVENVYFVHWFGNDTSNMFNMSAIELVTTGIGNGTWYYVFMQSLHSLRPINYYWACSDLHGTWNRTEVVRVNVTDDDRVEYVEYLTLEEVGTGETLTFRVKVRDNIAVLGGVVHYRFGDGGELLRGELVPENVTSTGNGTYAYSIEIPLNMTKRIKYYFVLFDTSANWVQSLRGNVTVNDGLAPTFLEDLSEEIAYSGLSYNFTANVTDNLDIRWVEVYYGVEGFSRKTAMMERFGTDEDGKGLWRATIPAISEDSVEPIVYYFSIMDESLNVRKSPSFHLEVLDVTGPSISPVIVNGELTTGDSFKFRVNIRDNIGITSVLGTWWFNDTDPVPFNLTELDVDDRGRGMWMYELTMPMNMTGSVTFEITAWDPSGNSRTHKDFQFIRDNDPPILVQDLTTGTPMKGVPFTVKVQVTDNLHVARVNLIYLMGSGGIVETEMVHLGDGRYTFTLVIPRTGVEHLMYIVNATDDEGNQRMTPERSLKVVNALPVIDFKGPWVVIEGEINRLDLEPLISDENDPIYALVLVCNDPRVEVDGLMVEMYLEEWELEFSLEMYVKDPDGNTRFDLQVEVLNVNDPPVILDVQPFLIAFFNESDQVYFSVEAFDIDIGDRLTVTWTSNISGTLNEIQEGQAFEWIMTGMEPGWHSITIIVSDGQDTATAGVEIIVIPADISDPDPIPDPDPLPDPFDVTNTGGLGVLALLWLILLYLVAAAIIGISGIVWSFVKR